MRPRWSSTPRHASAGDAWIRHEFARRGLAPPHCTPEALARALEQERHMTIVFRAHVSHDTGVSGLLYRPEGYAHLSIIVFRPTLNLALQRLILFHELAHILFGHALTEVVVLGVLRGYMVSDEDEARAEAFAVGAMQYSFLDTEAPRPRTEGEDDVTPSAFGQFLNRTGYWP